MPGQESGTAVHVRRLMDFILLEPVGDCARRKACSVEGVAGEKAPQQCNDRISELVLLRD